MKEIFCYAITLLLPLLSISTVLQGLLGSPVIFVGSTIIRFYREPTYKDTLFITTLSSIAGGLLFWIGISKIWMYFLHEQFPDFLWPILLVILYLYTKLYGEGMNAGFIILRYCEAISILLLFLYFTFI